MSVVVITASTRGVGFGRLPGGDAQLHGARWRKLFNVLGGGSESRIRDMGVDRQFFDSSARAASCGSWRRTAAAGSARPVAEVLR